MQANLAEVKRKIAALAKRSVVGPRLKGVVVEAGGSENAGEFLRVVIELDRLKGLDPADVLPLIEEIEAAIGKMDERFPSVRFAEAA